MVKKESVSTNKELVGVRGWLLFFLIIFILTALGAFLRIINLLIPNTLISQPTLFMKTIEIILLAIAFIIYLFTIIFILKKKFLAKKLSIISVWVYFITALIQKIFSFQLLPATQEYYKSKLGVDISSFISSKVLIFQTISAIIFGVAWAILVTLYFIKSKRVRNTLIN